MDNKNLIAPTLILGAILVGLYATRVYKIANSPKPSATQTHSDVTYPEATGTLKVPQTNTDSLVVYSFCSDKNERHEWVDLGLSVKWASCNVGASSPEDFGAYFAWGETDEKTEYSNDSYTWHDDPQAENESGNIISYPITKYDGKDGRIQLERSDDAACINWGSHFRMPTKNEWEELRDNCDWVWTTLHNVKGYLIKSRKNTNTIFLPAAGSKDKYSTNNNFAGEGYYLSSTLHPERPYSAWMMRFSDASFYLEGEYSRISGHSIRPVWDAKLEPAEVILPKRIIKTPNTNLRASSGSENGYSWVDLGLSVKWATRNVGAYSEANAGDYFAWGDVIPHKDNHGSKYYDRDRHCYTKYVLESSYKGTKDGKTVLEMMDDPAHENWGGNWRVPTDAEWTELRRKCGWQWMKISGQNGYLVYSKENGNSIFLPAAGMMNGSMYSNHEGAFGYYWSSSLHYLTDMPDDVEFAGDVEVYVKPNTALRGDGLSIRPVLDR